MASGLTETRLRASMMRGTTFSPRSLEGMEWAYGFGHKGVSVQNGKWADGIDKGVEHPTGQVAPTKTSAVPRIILMVVGIALILMASVIAQMIPDGPWLALWGPRLLGGLCFGAGLVMWQIDYNRRRKK